MLKDKAALNSKAAIEMLPAKRIFFMILSPFSEADSFFVHGKYSFCPS